MSLFANTKTCSYAVALALAAVSAPHASAERYTVFVSNFASGTSDYEIKFGTFRSSGNIKDVAAIDFECVSTPWPESVSLSWTDREGKHLERTFPVQPLAPATQTESRHLYIVFAEEVVAVRGWNSPDGGVHRCMDPIVGPGK